MKKIIIIAIRFYQSFFSFPLRVLSGATFTCKFSPSCSEYAVEVIEELGAIKGGIRALVRLLSCQPFVR